MNPTPDIVVYTVPGCSRCRAVMDHLYERGAKYRVVMVQGNFGGLRELVRLTGSSTVPVTRLGDEWVLGFDPEALDRLLGLSNPV